MRLLVIALVVGLGLGLLGRLATAPAAPGRARA
jgi:hypothetical protein